MRVVFLDFDGVSNADTGLDESAVSALVDRAKAAVVISSSWMFVAAHLGACQGGVPRHHVCSIDEDCAEPTDSCVRGIGPSGLVWICSRPCGGAALGACTADEQCGGIVGESICSRVCRADADCPEGFACTGSSDASHGSCWYAPSPDPVPPYELCRYASECELPEHKCATLPGGWSEQYCTRTGCLTDADCASGHTGFPGACIAGVGGGSVCTSECVTRADCLGLLDCTDRLDPGGRELCLPFLPP